MIGRIAERAQGGDIILSDGEFVPLFAEGSQAWKVDFDDGRSASVVVRREFIETYERHGLEQMVVDRAAHLVAAGMNAARL